MISLSSVAVLKETFEIKILDLDASKLIYPQKAI